MIDRRKFIKSISALGISLPTLHSNLLLNELVLIRFLFHE